MKLSTYAKKLGITYRTAFIHFQKGMIKGAYQLPSGTIIVPDEIKENEEYTVIYARVSSSENKSNLESQAKRLQQFCEANGWIVNEVVKECASGLNDKRPKLQKILSERKATRLVIEHKDRLTRFGFEYIKTLFKNCEIIIVNETKNDEDDIMQDFISIITSFCARIYGNRRSQRKTEKIIEELNKQ
jgi:predicted site-specific integrase-resolvase